MINKEILLFLLLYCFACSSNNSPTENSVTKYEPDWESLSKYEVPDWWLNSKFGIYFHWGPYSVPAHETEWYSTLMYRKDHPVHKHHVQKYGNLKTFGYKDFIPEFTAEHFDANEWAELFKNAGAQFAGPVAEHADGFAMWDSQKTKWDAMEMGPKKDIVGLMEKAVKSQGMKFILTYHRHWLYAWYPTWDETTDAFDPSLSGLYGPKVPEGTFVMATEITDPLPNKEFNDEWLARLNELMDKYEPDIIWFDNKMDIIDEDYRKQFLANFYNNAQKWDKEVVCTYKFEDLPKGTAVLDLERSRMSEKKDFPWLTDDSIDWGAWCHVDDPDYKSVDRLIDFLVDVVSKNGAVLLNITPKANGEIPEEVKERLLKMGGWLKTNGEAIYDTRPWRIYGEGPTKVTEGHLSEQENKDNTDEDIRYTTKGEILYATFLDWPAQKALIPSLNLNSIYFPREIGSVELLGSEEILKWERTIEGLEVNLNMEKPNDYAYVLKIHPK